jgi:hypothetical protein
LRLSEPLFPGSSLQIRLKNTVIFGEVRYCRKVNDQFDAGIRIQDMFSNLPSGDRS